MGHLLLNLLKLLAIILVVAVAGIAIYTLFFDPTTSVSEVTQEIELQP